MAFPTNANLSTHSRSSEGSVSQTLQLTDEVYDDINDNDNQEYEEDGDIEDEFDEIPQEQLNQNEDESIRQRISKAQTEMHEILKELDEEQTARYEIFRRIRLPAPMIKKIIQKTLESLIKEGGSTTTLNQNVIIAIAGISKVFVGELVEEAKAHMSSLGEQEDVPIHPSHLLEAQRRLRRRLEHKSSPDSNALALRRKGIGL